MGFLKIEDKTFVVFGLANKKSVAAAIAKVLIEEGAKVIHVVRSEQRAEAAKKLFPDSPVFLCDVEDEANIIRVRKEIGEAVHESDGGRIDGLVHSIAYANYSEGLTPFYGTIKKDFLQAFDISCFSFISICNHFRDLFERDAAAVTISISTTSMAAENYGYMAPIKAALNSSICFLAKSFSSFSNVRFNAVAPSLLKTSASAGIPGYVDSYLYAEKAILRKKALKTSEAADLAAFLLSPRSSGITAQTMVVDAGMSVNYFDSEIVQGALS
ncbi:MAG TPA: SDR family oxidoreductase [Desulfobacterales bacterium]|nr:SDR family oxidoreductase [Desulfobacterales bacterium]